MNHNPAAQDAAKVLELYPQMGSTALFLPHVRDEFALAATDGNKVYLSSRYFALEPNDRRGVLLHEYLHAALSHPERAGMMRLKLGAAFSLSRFNAAGDALINTSIKNDAASGQKSRHLGLPDIGLIYFKAMIDAMKKLGVETDDLTLNTATIEQLYFRLGEAEAAARERLADQSDALDQTSGGLQQDKARRHVAEQAARTIIDWCTAEPDLQPAEGTLDELRRAVVANTERLRNAKSTYGHAPANLIEQIKGDIPQSKTPWEKKFRYLAARHLGRERPKTPFRPSNAMLSQFALGSAPVWTPGRQRSPSPRVLVVADSSGSVGIDQYARMLGEIERMRRRTNAIISFALADAALHTVHEITRSTALAAIGFEGRGGTSFIPALAYAEANAFDLVIYMTDLEGTFPATCKVPVIWAYIENHRSSLPSVPFGDLLVI